ncbi:MAG TPA: hypothetical protein VI819_02915 [Patescibacteria group bacterium]|nr:hypothetical protein [Patescibacteria group bacterium]
MESKANKKSSDEAARQFEFALPLVGVVVTQRNDNDINTRHLNPDGSRKTPQRQGRRGDTLADQTQRQANEVTETKKIETPDKRRYIKGRWYTED